jgi:hypothetical protein
MLSHDEISFLAAHGLTEADVYDARGQSKRWREYRAKQAGKDVILTHPVCRTNSRHRLRTRAGHCIQCKTINIAFQRRESERASVCIAGSLSGKLIKIGESQEPWKRVQVLCNQSYGGFSDWTILISKIVDNAGEVERTISDRIAGRRFYAEYTKDGRPQLASEMIRCSYSSALKAMVATVGEIQHYDHWLTRWPQYDFINGDKSD